MKRPIIGITTDYNDRMTQYMLPYGYATSIEKAGGLPFLIPYKSDLALIPDFVDALDGMLFAGGNDLDPKVYGQDWHPMAVPIDPDRQKFEMALLAEVERRRKPILGVCLGCQLLNVYRGGQLAQFLPDENRSDPIEHRRFGLDWSQRHAINLESDSVVAKSLGKTEVIANSSHKQAVKVPGKGLRVIATAPDGVIEGIEDPSLPLFVGVQWHPERMSDEADHLALFKLLVEKAEANRAARADGTQLPQPPPFLFLQNLSIEFDLSCDRCDYNLRGLKIDSQCPECGTPIAESVWTQDPVFDDARRLELLRGSLRKPAADLGFQEDLLLFVVEAIEKAPATRIAMAEHAQLSAKQICGAICNRALEYFNDRAEAEELLREWGLRDSADIGKIIQILVRQTQLPENLCEMPPEYEGQFTVSRLWDQASSK